MSFSSKTEHRTNITTTSYETTHHSVPIIIFMQRKLEEEKLELLYKFEELERRGINV